MIEGGENLYLQRQMTPASLITELAAAELAGKAATTANQQEPAQSGADGGSAPAPNERAAPLLQDFDFAQLINKHMAEPVQRDADDWSRWITERAMEIA